MPAGKRLPALNDAQFLELQSLVERASGVILLSERRAVIAARLARRLRHYKLATFSDYLLLLARPDQGVERQRVIELLVAKETYFFREHPHFEFLAHWLATKTGPVQLWSAACASGEEAYSLAMVASEHARNDNWHVLASDISPDMLERTRHGIYDIAQARYFPEGWLQRYCQWGIGEMAGRLQVQTSLRERVSVRQINLIRPLPDDLGVFDVIVLRNLLSYFSQDDKQQVVQRLLTRLRPGGLLLIGHSESIHGLDLPIRPILPSVFERLC
ncbi:protein-glutamate O-methyltransferase CheR [Pseudomonas tussilaginis]|uniref:CheR family methyltransferase n=1 Tax=unclassified Pseudomonas TaxID=196821 RepID=UPI000C6CD43F|nr:MULTISPECIES: protein-glutamate O-methyltransferase CheR [unclassified Pseudomonas]QYX46678.1 protein-glutamate O-methyltransferase CheR [Pseudomonas sp. S11A 273]